MFTKPIIVTVVTSLLFCSGCAAKNRWFSRRDYSEMQDPFMQSEAVAAADESGDDSTNSTGRARLTADLDNSPQQSNIARLPGPKPIHQTGVASEPTGPSGQIANASYPEESGSAAVGSGRLQAGAEKSGIRSYQQGPELSDFLSRKGAEAAQTSSATAGGTNTPGGSRTAATTTVPSNRAAATPQLSEEAATFGSFLQQKSSSAKTATQQANAASQQATQSVQESEESVSDFSAWAEQRKSDWSKEGTQAASNTQSGFQDEFNATGRQAKRITDDTVTDFSKPDFDSEEVAQPLISNSEKLLSPQKPRPNSATVFDHSNKPTSPAEANPFENPFDFGESEPVAVQPRESANPGPSSKPATPRNALDDSFQMDNGWKPAHMTRP